MKKLTQILAILSLIITLSACSKTAPIEQNVENLANNTVIETPIIEEEIEEEIIEDDNIFFDAFDFIHLNVAQAINVQNIDYYLNKYEGLAGGRLMYSKDSPYTFEFEGFDAPNINEDLLYKAGSDLSIYKDNIAYIIVNFAEGGTVNEESFTNKTIQEILNFDDGFKVNFDEMYNEYYISKIYRVENSTKTHYLSISFKDTSDIVTSGSLSNK